jgi:uncharacterized protein (TIRG00374 family)
VRGILANATILPLILALVIFGIDFFLRAVRFQLLLNGVLPRPVPLMPTVAPFVASFGVSDVLPFRVGDIFRIYWFQQGFGIKVATLVGIMIVERIMDLLSLVILGILALSAVDSLRSSPLFSGSYAILASVLIVLTIIILTPGFFLGLLGAMRDVSHSKVYHKIITFMETALSAMHQAGSWRKIIFNLCFSVVIWVLESCVFVAVWISLGENPLDWFPPVISFVASSLATILPGLPGHFGSFDYFGVQAFVATGVNAEKAAAIVLLAHLIIWAPTAIFALVWLLAARPRRARVKTTSGPPHLLE